MSEEEADSIEFLKEWLSSKSNEMLDKLEAMMAEELDNPFIKWEPKPIASPLLLEGSVGKVEKKT